VAAKFVDKEQKRRSIARAAMEAFSEKGFDAASVKLVADAAGVGKGTIYEYFDSKEELVAEAVLIWIEDIIDRARSSSQSIEDPELRLKTFVSESMAMFTSDQQAIKTTISIFQIVLSNIDDSRWLDSIQSAFKDTWKIIVQIIMEGSEKGVFNITAKKEAEKIAINLVAYLDGICLHYYVSGGKFDLMTQVDHYMKCLIEKTLK
jgi:AcrR family transcriptional regulator